MEPYNHERVFPSCHHGKREPVELETERYVIGMDSLEAAMCALRQPGGSARRCGTAEERGGIIQGYNPQNVVTGASRVSCTPGFV